VPRIGLRQSFVEWIWPERPDQVKQIMKWLRTAPLVRLLRRVLAAELTVR
jgi:hypothetical protein